MEREERAGGQAENPPRSERQPDGDPGTESAEQGQRPRERGGTGAGEGRDQPDQEERQGGYGDDTGGGEVAEER